MSHEQKLTKYGSPKVHLLLFPFTMGLGNISYAFYCYKRHQKDGELGEIPTPDTEQEKEVVGAHGKNANIAVMDNKVIISRVGGPSTVVTQGVGKGDKEIWLSSINGLEFSEANGTAGYLQINQSGRDEEDGGVIDAANDENSVLFRGHQEEDFKRIKRTIEKRANE